MAVDLPFWALVRQRAEAQTTYDGDGVPTGPFKDFGNVYDEPRGTGSKAVDGIPSLWSACFATGIAIVAAPVSLASDRAWEAMGTFDGLPPTLTRMALTCCFLRRCPPAYP